MLQFAVALVVAVFLAGCGTLIREKKVDNSPIAIANQKPMTPEQAEEVMAEVGESWLYGNGLGETLLTVGTVLIFPPFGLVVLGNAALDVAGYEQVGVSTFLPDEDKRQWHEMYDNVVRGPGVAAAALAGEEYRPPSEVEKRMAQLVKGPPEPELPGPVEVSSAPPQ